MKGKAKKESKAVLLQNRAILNNLNSSFIERSFEDALKQFNDSQEAAQKILNANKPSIELIARQASMLAESVKAVKSFRDSSAFKMASELEAKVKAMAEIFTIPQIAIMQNHNESYEYILQTPKREATAEEIAEIVMQKIDERISGKKLKSALTPPCIEMPNTASWEELEIKFINQFDVEIFHNGEFQKKANYEELGFGRQNTKDNLPNKQWEFLRQLAIIYETGTIQPTIENLKFTLKNIIKSKDDCMKTKEHLGKSLKKAFGIRDNPFYKYDPDKGYKIKFKLKPETILRGDGELRKIGSQYIEDFDTEKSEEKTHYLD